MTCKEIISDWLKKHGYDGLCNCEDVDGCGCGIGDDFMPCYPDCMPECEPAYRDDKRDGWYRDKPNPVDDTPDNTYIKTLDQISKEKP